jgi:ABC-2 type transport system permease protein
MKSFKQEVIRYLRESIVFYPDYISDMIMTLLLFAMFLLLTPKDAGQNYLGYAYWYLMTGTISDTAISISYEKRTGMIEHLLIKSRSIKHILFNKVAAWIVINLVKVSIVSAILMAFLKVEIQVSIVGILAFLVSLIGIAGLSLILVSVTLRYTKTASFIALFNYALLFLSGSILPSHQMPKWLLVASYLFPMNTSSQILKGEYQGATLLILVSQSLVLFVIGNLFFNWSFKHAKINGISSSY